MKNKKTNINFSAENSIRSQSQVEYISPDQMNEAFDRAYEESSVESFVHLVGRNILDLTLTAN